MNFSPHLTLSIIGHPDSVMMMDSYMESCFALVYITICFNNHSILIQMIVRASNVYDLRTDSSHFRLSKGK